jgi:chemotaxis protein histidine kinase CheA
VAVELNGEGMTTRTGSKFTSKTIGNIYRRAKGLPSYEQLLLARVGTPLPTLPDAVREPQAVEAELVTDDDTPTSILTQAPDYSHSPPQMIEDEPPASPAPVLSGRLVEVPADQLQQALELASQAAAAQAKVAQYEAVIAQYDEKSKALLTQVERAQTIVQENVNLRVQVQDLKDQLQQLEFRNAHWLNTKELIQEALKSAPYPLPLQKKES